MQYAVSTYWQMLNDSIQRVFNLEKCHIVIFSVFFAVFLLTSLLSAIFLDGTEWSIKYSIHEPRMLCISQTYTITRPRQKENRKNMLYTQYSTKLLPCKYVFADNNRRDEWLCFFRTRCTEKTTATQQHDMAVHQIAFSDHTARTDRFCYLRQPQA